MVNDEKGRAGDDTPASHREGIAFDMQEDGVLWLINRVVFHPRGFALGHIRGTDKWILIGDGTEPWSFAPEADDESFALVEALIARARPAP